MPTRRKGNHGIKTELEMERLHPDRHQEDIVGGRGLDDVGPGQNTAEESRSRGDGHVYPVHATLATTAQPNNAEYCSAFDCESWLVWIKQCYVYV